MRGIKHHTYSEIISFAAENRTFKEALFKGRSVLMIIFGAVMYSIFAEVLYHPFTQWFVSDLMFMPLILSVLLYIASIVFDLYSRWHFSTALANGIWRGQEVRYRSYMLFSGFLTTASIVPIFTTILVPITGMEVAVPFLKMMLTILAVTFMIGMPFDWVSWKKFNGRIREEEDVKAKKKR